MEYHGRLYGKVGGQYFDTGLTTEDVTVVQTKKRTIGVIVTNDRDFRVWVHDWKDNYPAGTSFVKIITVDDVRGKYFNFIAMGPKAHKLDQAVIDAARRRVLEKQIFG